MLVSLYKGACDIDISVDVAKRLVADAKKDFRVAANDMQHIVKLMNENGKDELTMEVLDGIRRQR